MKEDIYVFPSTPIVPVNLDVASCFMRTFNTNAQRRRTSGDLKHKRM